MGKNQRKNQNNSLRRNWYLFYVQYVHIRTELTHDDSAAAGWSIPSYHTNADRLEVAGSQHRLDTMADAKAKAKARDAPVDGDAFSEQPESKRTKTPVVGPMDVFV